MNLKRENKRETRSITLRGNMYKCQKENVLKRQMEVTINCIVARQRAQHTWVLRVAYNDGRAPTRLFHYYLLSNAFSLEGITQIKVHESEESLIEEEYMSYAGRQ